MCFFILNFIPWIKNEGYLFLIIFTLSLSFLIKYFKNKKDILTFIILSWTFLIIKNLIFYKYLSFNLIHSGNIPSEYHFYDIINLVKILCFNRLINGKKDAKLLPDFKMIEKICNTKDLL